MTLTTYETLGQDLTTWAKCNDPNTICTELGCDGGDQLDQLVAAFTGDKATEIGVELWWPYPKEA